MKGSPGGSRKGRVRWVALVLPALAAAAPASAQLSVDELEVFLSADGAPSGVIQVTNETDRPAQVLVQVQDWERDVTGANQFLELGSHERSCRERLQVFPLGMRLEPRQTQPLRVTFEGDADASCWNVVFIQTNDPPSPTSAGSQLTYVVRTGVKVYVEPAGAAAYGEISAIRETTAADSARAVEIDFRNLGEAHLKPRGVVEIRRADNSVAGHVELTEFPLEPGGLRTLAIPLPELSPGQYVVLALLDYGGPDIAAHQLELVVR